MAIGINSTEIPWESLDDNGVKGIILLLWVMIIKKQLAILNYYHCLPENSEMMSSERIPSIKIARGCSEGIL